MTWREAAPGRQPEPPLAAAPGCKGHLPNRGRERRWPLRDKRRHDALQFAERAAFRVAGLAGHSRRRMSEQRATPFRPGEASRAVRGPSAAPAGGGPRCCCRRLGASSQLCRQRPHWVIRRPRHGSRDQEQPCRRQQRPQGWAWSGAFNSSCPRSARRSAMRKRRDEACQARPQNVSAADCDGERLAHTPLRQQSFYIALHRDRVRHQGKANTGAFHSALAPSTAQALKHR